jgi:hypothetical protein
VSGFILALLVGGLVAGAVIVLLIYRWRSRRRGIRDEGAWRDYPPDNNQRFWRP